MRNLRLALRTLTRTPVVTAIAALSLGLGIGANSAIYSMLHRIMRQDLAVPAPDRLVNLAAPGPKPGGSSCSLGSCDNVFSYPMFRDLEKSNQQAFTAIAAHHTFEVNVGYERRAFAEKYSSVRDTIPPVFSTPHRQERFGEMNFYVRTDADPNTIVRAIPAVVRSIDPMLPVERLRTMPEAIEQNIFLDRMISTMSSAFALLATLLASIGLYGVLAYSVAQRTREIGVRMALGADSARVRRLVLGQVGLMVLVGGVIGLAGAIALGRVARAMLYEMSGADPVVMVVSATLLGLVALGAGYVPARRASRVNPMQALRYE